MAASIYIPSGLAAALPGGSRKLREVPADGTLIGTSGDDLLIGGSERDTLLGGAGNDFLDGGDGDDVMLGGDGDDTYLVTGVNDSIVEAADGGDEDWVWLRLQLYTPFLPVPLHYQLPDQVENVRVVGMLDSLRGNDLDNTIDLTKGLGDIQVQGSGGDDLILIGDRVDALAFGGAGSNVIKGGALDDVLIGGDDEDKLYGGGGRDGLDGNAGDDKLFGGSGDDFLRGGDGDNTLHGGSGFDQLVLVAGKNLAYGEAGDDHLEHGLGDDTVFGGAGDDLVFDLDDSGGNLVAFGGSGSDRFWLDGGGYGVTGYGGSGRDFLQGAKDNDLLHGDQGDDVLASSGGVDSFCGGAGADAVQLRPDMDGADVWMDFSRAERDVVDILQITGNAIKSDPVGEGYARLVDVRLEDGTAAVAVDIDRDGGGDHFERLLYLRDQKVADLSGYAVFQF